MGDVIKKMRDEVPNGFCRLQVLLSANMAKPAIHLCVAIQAYRLFSLFMVTQRS